MKRVVISLLSTLILSAIGVAQSGTNKGPVEGLPRIVVRVKLTDQTAKLPSHVIFTPKSSGLFRASVTMIITVPSPGTNDRRWYPIIESYDVAAEFAKGPYVDVSDLGSQSAAYVFPAKKGKPVKLSTFSQGDVSGSAYDLFIVIERLTKIPSF